MTEKKTLQISWPESKSMLRWLVSFLGVLYAVGIYELARSHAPANIADYGASWKILIGTAILGILSAVVVWFLPAKVWTWLKTIKRAVSGIFYRAGWANLLFIILSVIIYLLPSWFLGEYVWFLDSYAIRIIWLMVVSLATGMILSSWRIIKYSQAFLQSAVLIGLVHLLAGYLPNFTDYPFSLSWSETSWYYYASFFFSRRIYGSTIIWPFLDIGRPFLLSVPFVIPNVAILVMRIWQVVLWVGITSLSAWLLQRRINKRTNLGFSLWFLAWAFIYVLAGSVYYHLQIMLILILIGANPRRPAASLPWLAAASILGGIVRINWTPTPAILALSLYFLEMPLPSSKEWLKYLKWPVVWGIVGVLTGTGAMVGYWAISGRLDTHLLSKVTAPLLWGRLLPNTTFMFGILLGTFLLAGTMLWLIGRSILHHRLGGLRSGLLAAMSVILLVGGCFASVKIGGGNNLHNLDAFWVILVLWGSYTLTGADTPQAGFTAKPLAGAWVVFFILIPCLWNLQQQLTLPGYDRDAVQFDLQSLRAITQQAASQGEEVLFIYQRHLITFGEITDVPVVPEYELEELTEMEMVNNLEYLQTFWDDLSSHRFGLIITDIQREYREAPTNDFGQEADAWWFSVTIPLTENYHEVLRLPTEGVQVWAPNP